MKDKNEKIVKVVIGCYAVALIPTVGVFFLWNFLEFGNFSWHIAIGDILNVLSSNIAATVILYSLFNKYLWRIPLIKKLLSIEVPYVGGIWIGELVSSYDSFATSQPVELEFFQTFTDIRECYNSTHAVEESIAAEILPEREGNARIVFVYKTTATADRKGYTSHEGAAILHVQDDGKLITGEYFNDPMCYQNRKATWGKYINLHRKPK